MTEEHSAHSVHTAPKKEPGPSLFPEMERLVAEVLSGIEVTSEQVVDEHAIIIDRKDLLAVCRRLKDNQRLSFDLLRCVSVVDYPNESVFQAVYHLYSIGLKHRMAVKTGIPYDDAIVDSVTSVWAGADWHEREAAELLGVEFRGHPNLRPLLLPDDFEGHPLRKSFKVPELDQARFRRGRE
ncbi:MAG: NADH-quinone oxidoreductase subunit C [Chloroflexi bacterium]|nr:NADH-quinone oxidoreductase subunit C [Chloroflexota bacterium]